VRVQKSSSSHVLRRRFERFKLPEVEQGIATEDDYSGSFANLLNYLPEVSKSLIRNLGDGHTHRRVKYRLIENAK
jgi:hypothetical protein